MRRGDLGERRLASLLPPARAVAGARDHHGELAGHFASLSRLVREDKALKGVKKIGDVNADNHTGVRKVMVDSGAFPGTIAPAGDIRDVQSRVEKQRAKLSRRTSEE